MTKKIIIAASIIYLLSPLITQAICPACTVAVGAGVGLSRWLGIDDTITGLWIGGLLISLTLLTVNWVNKKNIQGVRKSDSQNGTKPKTSYFSPPKIPQPTLVLALFYYLATIVPLYLMDIMGHPDNTLWGIDKLLIGITVGSIVFKASAVLHFWLKEKNSNRVYFPFQKVVIPIICLSLASLVFYLVTK